MDLGYINARIRAWKGDLFKEADYNGFLSTNSLDGFIGKLKETCYGHDLEEARARFKERGEMAVLEKGLRGNLFRTLKKIFDESPSDIRIFIKAVVSFWEAYNLKTIIRGIHKGISPDEIYSILIPAGDFDEAALKELTQPRDIRLMIQILDTWGSPYGRVLKECIPDYRKEKEIIKMEINLDRFVHNFYLNLLGNADLNTSMVKELIQYRIDAANIITLFKFSKEQSFYPLIDYYLSGGRRLTEEDFVELGRCEDGEGLLKGLVSKMREADWREMLKTADPTEPSLIEENMEDLIGRNFCRKAVIHPLSIAVVVCFYFSKVREIKNLRLIGRGKESSISVNEMRGYLRMSRG